ncbi:MAG TPA: hypothetical protein PKH19_05225, partial [Candidatus Syntrophosphaera sp.]|nr:hypothetical protein [Candidatus Syntrophosphaera sp.]
MDKRTLIAMFAVIVIFMILQTYVFKPKPAPAEPAATADTLQQEAPLAAAADTTTAAAVTSGPV